MNLLKYIAGIILLGGLIINSGCDRNEIDEPTESDIINEWIWDVMNDVYFWADDVDQNLYPTDEVNPETFFYSILSPEDKFSWIVDDYMELINSFNNIEFSTGMSPYFIRKRDSDIVIAAIEYVSAGSPADSAGIKRGDIISNINGQTMNIENYAKLFYSENVTLGFSEFVNETLVPNDRVVSMTAKVIEQNPINYYDIFDYQDKKIGYIAYTAFSSGQNNRWKDSIDLVLMEFKDQGITELIMDVRYNPGGMVSMANHIAASIAPADVPANSNIFIKYLWNEAYSNYFRQEEGEDSDNLIVLFTKDIVANLDLESVYFLTSSHSASASELIMIGLDPYMQVVRIGQKTYGKSYGSVTLPDTETPPRHTWALQPIVFQYSNDEDFTGFIDGLDPNIEVFDNMLDAKPFGDFSDPILATALEEITGVAPAASTKKARDRFNASDYETLPDPVKEMKNRAIINH